MGRTRRESADTKENKRLTAPTNYYAVMGIHDFARGSEAKRAYHRLALEWHPDRQVHASENRQKEAEAVFKRVNEAYAILSDSVRRKEFDDVLRRELLGVVSGDTGKKEGAKDTSKNSRPAHEPNRNSSEGRGTRLILCPACGLGTEAKAGKMGGPSIQCRGCSTFFHEVYCAECKGWGATKGRRGESTMRRGDHIFHSDHKCGCGNVFCQTRCPSCWRWNTFNGEAQGGRTRSCGFCGCKFHEGFCPRCSSWGVWEGKKGCRSLSCDCGGLFYEISCQSCGMWGSVEGRHADANNSLRCGTCGSESHEAFCPTCRQWDSYPGSKGESTLTCKSPRCRGRRQEGNTSSPTMTTTKFFQVFCESCVCWRSVLREKDAVGMASIRCEGCKSNLRGATCPACGNWDQLQRRPHPHQHQHQVFRRGTRLREKGSQPDGSDFRAAEERGAESSSLLLARPPHVCTSCGHQPPGDGETPEEGFSTGHMISLTGVVHEDVEAVAPPVAVTADQTTHPGAGAGATSPAEGNLEDGGPQVRHAPQMEEAKNEEGAKEGGEEGQGGGEEHVMAPRTSASAPIHGVNNNPRRSFEDVGSCSRTENVQEDASLAETLAGNHTVIKENSRHGRHQVGSGTSSSAGSTVTADDPAEEDNEEGERPDFQSLRGMSAGSREDGEGPLPAAPVPSEGDDVFSRAAQPPPRSTLRRRGGRRPFVPRHPSPSSPAAVAASTAGTTAEAELAAVKVGTLLSDVRVAKEGDGEEEGEDGRGTADEGATAAAVLATPSSTTSEENRTTSAAKNDQPTTNESDRPTSRHRVSGGRRRRRKKRLGAWSSSPSPSPRLPSSKLATAKPATGLSSPSEHSTSPRDGRPPTPTSNAAADGAAAGSAGGGCRVTFAAVPRESSPPPPPGMKISENGEGRGSGGPGARTGRGRGGAKEMVHLAFCSRCQEYQSWRAPLTSTGHRRPPSVEKAGGGGRGGSSGVRRNCAECGDLYANVSYYPAR